MAGPLNVIELTSKRVKTNTENDQKLLERIIRSSEKITEQLDQIKKLKSLEDGKVDSEREKVCLKTCVDDVLDQLTLKSEEKNIDFDINIPSGTYLLADKTILMNQILQNILTNAIKFSFPNGRILIDTQADDDFTFIKVRDYGIGIPQTILDKIFLIDAKTSRRGTMGEVGTGYGMPIVKSFIENLDGTIEINSWADTLIKDESGTEIILKLKTFKE